MAGSNEPAQVALLLDYNHLWAIDLQPHREGFGYLRHLFLYYRALQRLGIPVDIIPAEADLKPYKLVISPTHFLIDEGEAARLTAYVQQGGNLLLGVRSGSKTTTNRVTDQPLPGLLRDLVGARVTHWQALPPGIAYDIETQIAGMGNQVGFWAESLHAEDGVEVLARYASGPYTGEAALTRHPVGAGTTSYLGFYPDLQSAQALVAHFAEAYHLDRMGLLPEGLIAGRRGGSTFLLNFTDRPLNVAIAGRDIDVPPRDLVKIDPDIS
jgi:beta-galactosidase